MCKYQKTLIFLLCLCLAIIAQNAYAYFDPGTGSLLIQALLALLGSALLFIKQITSRIESFLTKIKLHTTKPDDMDLYVKKYILLAACIGSYVAIYYVSHNIDKLGVVGSAISVTMFVLLSVLFVLFFSFVLQKRRHKERILCGMLFVLFLYLMHLPIWENVLIFLLDFLQLQGIPNATGFIHFIVLLFFFVLSCFSFFLGYRLFDKISKITIVIFIMMTFPLFHLVVYAYQYTKMRSPSEVYHQDTLLSKQDVLIDEHTSFVIRTRRNVYFLLFDGLTSVKGLEILPRLGVSVVNKASDHLEKLKERQFTYYPQFYTNAQETKFAMSSYFYMNTKVDGSLIHTLLPHRMMRIIAGDSPVFQIFKQNSYHTNIVIPEIGNFERAGLMGKHCFASNCIGEDSYSYLHEALYLFERVVLKSNFLQSRYDHSVYNYNFNLDILNKLASYSNNSFTYWHILSPMHAPTTHTDSRGICSEEVETHNYKLRLEKAYKIMIQAADIIISNDTNAIIIFASDHGPYIFNRCALRSPLLTREEVIERQGAFLTVRWPEDYDGRYDKDIKSSANLFRYVFSYLLDHEKLLVNKPDDDAFYQYKGEVIKSIDNGVILPPPAAELKGND